MNQQHPQPGRFRYPNRPWSSPVLWLSLTCILAGLGADSAREFLRYQRPLILGGEWWRLLTGHLVHLGWSHLWLNLAALVILASLFADVLSRRDWWLVLLVSALSIDAGLLLLDQSVVWYVGLSGVLHGVIMLGGLRLLRGHTAIGLILVGGVLVKLGWEQWQGPLPFTESAAAGPVLVNAHLYGALGGALCCLAIWLSGCLRRAPAPL